MGTEEEKGGGGGGARVVPTAGTIVWVRRRNGSWWPGRILDPEELPASQLMSPRSGTPVKLLGREDASVDWYNLEKSKRVKAFRCGEFDACIGRAEAALGFPIKKREKYARREDAILHALELERQQKQGIISNYPSNKASGSLGSELNNFSSEIYVRNFEPGVHSKLSRDKSQIPFQKAALSLKEENMGGSLYAYNGKDAKQFRLKYGGPEAGLRMRGLQDFGLRTASSKRKTISWETSEKLGDNIAADYPGEGPLMRSASYDGGSKSLFSLTKKRSSGGIFEESLGKRRDRRRPLVQVLQNSAKIPPSLSVQSDYDGGSITVEGATDLMGVLRPRKKSRYVYLPGSIDDSVDNRGYPPEQMPSMSRQFELDSFGDEYTSSGLIESDCSDFSKGNYIEPDAEEANLFMGMEELEAGSKDSRRHVSYDSSSYEIPDELEKTKTDEMAIAACIPQLSPHEQSADGSAEIGISKWHMKGKRNVRNIGKRPMDAVDGNKTFTGVNRSDGYSIEMAYENKRSSFNVGKMSIFSQNSSGRGFYHKKEDFSYDDDMIGDNHMFGHGDTRYSSFFKAGKHHQRKHSSFHDSDNYSHVISLSRWEADGPSHTAHKAYWMESEECFDPVFANDPSGELEPMLVDVDLKVQAASYRGERVPLVSLMSRLNGKAIVGHPIQIEIVEDGSTALLVCRNDSFLEESTAPPRVWKTARRTTMQRIPRSNPGASALDGDDAEHLPYPGIESKPLIKKPHSGHLDHHARLSKRGHFHIQQSMSGFQMELRNRISLSSQKIRMLSSIAIKHKLGGENVDVKLARGGSILGGLIKPERTLPLVACVPLKVAFSRILEALGRPSSAVAHRVRMTSSAIRNPS